MKKIISFILVISVLLFVTGCGPALPPTPGHYTATNLNVSFDLTSTGIYNFEIDPPHGGYGAGGGLDLTNYSCRFLSDTININPDGSFSFQSQRGSKITGKINGSIANGHFSSNSNDGASSEKDCLSAQPYQIDIDWSARLSGPANTPVPTPIPAKLGHYAGTNPDVSFDVTSKGIENFWGSGNVSTGLGGCNYGVGSGMMSIDSTGNFSNRMFTHTDSVTGEINGENAKGTLSFTSCSSTSTHYYYEPGFGDSWSATWVGPSATATPIPTGTATPPFKVSILQKNGFDPFPEGDTTSGNPCQAYASVQDQGEIKLCSDDSIIVMITRDMPSYEPIQIKDYQTILYQLYGLTDIGNWIGNNYQASVQNSQSATIGTHKVTMQLENVNSRNVPPIVITIQP